jgi:hypothetical protein
MDSSAVLGADPVHKQNIKTAEYLPCPFCQAVILFLEVANEIEIGKQNRSFILWIFQGNFLVGEELTHPFQK